jgi:hypothetical protein
MLDLSLFFEERLVDVDAVGYQSMDLVKPIDVTDVDQNESQDVVIHFFEVLEM